MSDNGHGGRPPRDTNMSGWLNWLKGIARGKPEQSLRESLEDIIDEHEEAAAYAPDQGEREMLRNLLEFGSMSVDDIMVPRSDIYAVASNISLDELVATFVESEHSRLVVFGESLDDVTGMVHVKDIMRYWNKRESFQMSAVLRQVLFVPPSLSLSEVLARMQEEHAHLAIVIDEYGGTDGLVTIEDLVEEIVGDIEDEHDEVEAPMFHIGADGVVDADARTPVEDVEAALETRLALDDLEEEIDTLGGLVVSLAGRVPEAGARVAHPSGIEFEVVDADPRQLKRVRIHRPELEAAAAEG